MECVPQLPDWALWAGCPEPFPGESFDVYVRRLGLDPEPLHAGLNETTACLANQRLASALMQEYPDGLPDYVAARRSLYVTHE